MINGEDKLVLFIAISQQSLAAQAPSPCSSRHSCTLGTTRIVKSYLSPDTKIFTVYKSQSSTTSHTIMSASAPATPPPTSEVVPQEVYLTLQQAQILSLLRTTNLHISLNTARLHAIRLREAFLTAILPPPEGRNPGDVAGEPLGASSTEEWGVLADKVHSGEEGMEPVERYLKRYLKLDQVVIDKKEAEKEKAAIEAKKAALEAAYAETVE